jgi:hypothetical protein
MASASPPSSRGSVLRSFKRGLAGSAAWLRREGQRLRTRLRRRSSESPTADGDARRKRRRRIVIGVIAALLAYPVLGTLALWTGLVEWVLKSEDLRVEIDNPAYTIWPGHVHAKRVMILANGETQFTLEGHDLSTVIRLIPLFQHRVHVVHLGADGVRYRMRVQVEDTRGIEERLAAYPPLPGLPGANVVREEQAAKTEERDPSWTVEVEGIDVKVAELWFMEYRYVGDGTLKGEFLVGPAVMRVGTSVQDLGPGQLRFGADHVIAENFGGRVTATIPEVNPEEHADESFLDLVTARITLKGDIQSMKHIGAYFESFDVSDGKGPFKADVALEKGWLGTESAIAYRTNSIRLKGDGFGIETDWKLDIDVQSDDGKAAAPEAKGEPAKSTQPGRAETRLDIRSSKAASSPHPRIQSSAETTYVTFSKRPKKSFTVQLKRQSHRATLKSTQIGSGMALRQALIDLPVIQTRDLADLDTALEKGSPLSVQGGSARGSLKLEVDQNHVARGPFSMRMDGVKFRLFGVDLGTDARAYTGILFDLKRKNTTLSDFQFSLADASMHVGDEDVDGWWAILSSQRVTAAKVPPESYAATLRFRAKDAEPILEALAEKDQLNDLIAKFTSLDDLTLIAKVRGRGEILDVTIESMESDVWDAAGRYYSNGKQSRLALVVGGKAVSIGIASDGKQTSIVPFARTDWLNAQLQAFPKPLEQVKPSKP